MTKKQNKNTKKRKIQKLTQDRHKLVLKTFVENLRNGMTMGEAMRLAGYSKAYSRNPNQLRETNAWQDLLEGEIKDEELVEKLKELIRHKEWRACDAGLEKAFRLKKKYEHENKRTIEFADLTDQELDEEISREVSEIIEIALSEEEKTGKQ